MNLRCPVFPPLDLGKVSTEIYLVRVPHCVEIGVNKPRIFRHNDEGPEIAGVGKGEQQDAKIPKPKEMKT